MVITLKPYNPISKPNWDLSSSVNVAVRVLTRYNAVLIDFGKLTDIISYSDSLSVDGGSGSWNIRLKATSDNINLLKNIHPGLVCEIFCARSADPLEGVILDPSKIRRKDTTPELPEFVAPSVTLPESIGPSGPIPASLNAFFGITNDADLYRLAVVAMTEGKPNSIVSQIDSAVSIGNRIQAGKWGKTASAVVSAPQQYEAWTRFGLQGVSDRASAIAALNKNGRSAAQLDSFLAALRNPSTVQNSIEHLKGSTDYRAYVPGVTLPAQPGDPQRSSDDNYYIPGGSSAASVSAAEAAQIYRSALGAVRNSNSSATASPTTAPSEKVSVSPTGGDPAFAGKVIMQRTGTKDSQGLENLKLTVYDRSGKPISEHTVNSGIASTQTRFGGAFTTNAGSLAPVEFGQYRIGQPVVSGEEGVGRIFIPTDPTFETNRSAIGFHVDANRSTAPGSAGCIVFATESDFAKFQTALQQSGATTFEFLKTVTTVTTQNGTQTTTPTVEEFPDVQPIDDPYLDKCPYLLMRGVITDYGRDTSSNSVLTLSGAGYGKIYEDCQVLTDITSPELQARSLEIRQVLQQVSGVSIIWYRLLKQWVENFWGDPTGWEARTRQIPFPPNYLARANMGGTVWSNLKALSIDGFFHLFCDHTGAIVWEKLPWSSKEQSLINGRNWENVPLTVVPSWTIIDWNDRLSERGIVNFLRCTQTNAGQSTNYAASIYNIGSIRMYGGPSKRELLFPIGTQGEQYFTSEPRRKQQATVTSFLSLTALESIRWYDRPVQRCAITMRGDAFLRIATKIEITEDWHNLKAKGAEYYVLGRSHSIDLANGSWTTSLDLVRDRRQRYLGIGVGEIPVIKGDGPDIAETTKTDPLKDWKRSPIFVTGAVGKLQKKPDILKIDPTNGLPTIDVPEINVPLNPDDYWYFDRITGDWVRIGNDPIAYARKEVIPNLDKPSKLPPPEVKLPKAGTGAIQTGPVSSPAGKLPSPFKSGYWLGSVYDLAGTLNTRRRRHEGVDLFPHIESDLGMIAMHDGVLTIKSAVDDGGYGIYFDIAFSGEWSGWTARYGHCEKIYASNGPVRRGQVVAKCGTTGFSTGIHLHLELTKGGQLVNPVRYLPPWLNRATSDAGADPFAGG